MKRLIYSLLFLCIAAGMTAQDTKSFVVANKDGESYLVQALRFLRDNSGENYSWNVPGFSNKYQKAFDISKLQFITRVSDELAEASSDEITEMLQNQSGNNQSDAEGMAAALQGNENVDEAFSSDGDNVVVKMKDTEEYVVYPMYELKPAFTENGDEWDADYMMPSARAPRPRQATGSEGKVAVFNYFQDAPGWELQNKLLDYTINLFYNNHYEVEFYGRGTNSGAYANIATENKFTLHNLNEVINHSSEYKVIIIMTHGFAVNPGSSCLVTCEETTNTGAGTRLTPLYYDYTYGKYFVTCSTALNTSSECILYLGSCYSIPENGFSTNANEFPNKNHSVVIGWDGKNSISQAHAAILFDSMIGDNAHNCNLKEALNKSFDLDPIYFSHP